MKTVVAFGEVLARISPQQGARFRQGAPGPWDLTFGGAEANVLGSLALLGSPTRLISALPDHPIADAALGFYAGLGVETRDVLRSDQGRLGLYFYENGAAQLPGQVLYDRDGSTISQTPADAYDWDAAFANAGTLFLTGITPGVSRAAAEATLRAATEAKQRGVKVVFDLNFRRKLWQWEPGRTASDLARKILPPLLQLTDLLLANEGAALDIFDLRAEGDTSVIRSTKVAEALTRRFPNLSGVAMTMRENLSASHNRWGALLYLPATGSAHHAPSDAAGCYTPYEVTPIVDRVGAGDAFAAGLIYALDQPDLKSPEAAIAFATAASCLAHAIPGDATYLSRADIEALLRSGGSGHVIR